MADDETTETAAAEPAAPQLTAKAAALLKVRPIALVNPDQFGTEASDK